MASPLLGFLRRFRIAVAAGSLGISVAILLALLGLPSFKIGPERTIGPPTAPASPVAPAALNEAREEQAPEPPAIEPGADNPPPIWADVTVLGDTASHPLPNSLTHARADHERGEPISLDRL